MQAGTDNSAGPLACMTGSRPDPVAALASSPGASAIFWELDPVMRHFRHADELARLLGIHDGTITVTVRQFCDAVDAGDREVVETRLAKAIAGATGLSLHFRLALSGPQDLTVVLYGQPVHQAGSLSHFAGLLFQVEDPRHAELLSLRAADRHKNEFIATMAHELRNPLSALLCAGELIAQTAPADGPLAAAATVVQRQVAHMVELVDEMRWIGFPGVARLVPAQRLCRFDEVIRNACEQAMPLLGARAHRFVAETETNGALVAGNFTQLVQIVTNLLNNAAKYTPNGGTVRLRTTVEGERLRCVVSDTGVGMTPEFIGMAFDAFVQAGEPAERKDAGVGLGLKLVREFAALHGGTVVARSAGQGRGSTFELELPVAMPTVN
jgi:signal transduction histidine kinase